MWRTRPAGSGIGWKWDMAEGIVVEARESEQAKGKETGEENGGGGGGGK